MLTLRPILLTHSPLVQYMCYNASEYRVTPSCAVMVQSRRTSASGFYHLRNMRATAVRLRSPSAAHASAGSPQGMRNVGWPLLHDCCMRVYQCRCHKRINRILATSASRRLCIYRAPRPGQGSSESCTCCALPIAEEGVWEHHLLALPARCGICLMTFGVGVLLSGLVACGGTGNLQAHASAPFLLSQAMHVGYGAPMPCVCWLPALLASPLAPPLPPLWPVCARSRSSETSL